MKLKLKLKRLMVIGAAAGIVALSFAAGLLAGQGIPPAGAAAEYPPELAVLWEAWHIIKNGFVDRAVVQDPAPLAYAAIKAMTDALGDTGHTRFLTPDEANSHDNFIQGKFYGIGVYIGLDDENRPIVVSPFDGSPAQKAGLKAGD
ncbi:MAG: S41 family peptidase [Anaerolineae bacterium]